MTTDTSMTVQRPAGAVHRALTLLHGEQYRSYQRRVPMLLPFRRRQG